MTIQKIQKALKIYVKSMFLIIIVNTLIFWIVLSIFQLKFPLLFAFITGLLSVVPVFGTLISCLIVFIFSLFDGQSFSSMSIWLEGLIYILIYLVFNQLIDFVVTPIILGRSIRISPVILLIAVIVSTMLFGFIGAFLAVPALIIVSVLKGDR